MSAPELSSADIRREVERVFSRPHRAFLTALYARGEAARFSVAERQWEVIPTRCETQMRAAMPLPGTGNGEGRVFLVDWTERPLPLDLACRLAAGRVYQVSPDARLAGLFDARQIDPGLIGSGLARVLLSGEISGLGKVPGIRLTRHDAFRHFLNAWAGFPLSDPLSVENLATWCHRSPVGPTLAVKSADSEAWRRLAQELREFIEHQAGPAGALVWAAFEQAGIARFFQVAVLVQAHKQRKDAVAEGLLQGRLPELAPGFGGELLRSGTPQLLAEVIRSIFDHLDPEIASTILQEADALIPNPSFVSTRAVSPWLPSGHAAREEQLAAALNELVSEPKWEAFNRVSKRLGELGQHGLDPVIRTKEQRETRQMAVRLAAYLVERAQKLRPGQVPVYQPAIDLATDYVAEGGLVDWCRGRLRGPLPFGNALNQAGHQVLRAADELRGADDRAFAEALIEWHAAGKPSNQVLPIENVTRQLVAGLMKGHQERKVLVIMMDGMSWAVAMQLLQRLDNERWAPILWRPKGFAGRDHLPPVLASLPTLTKVSRGAFFAGRADARDGNKHTQEDARRWDRNKALIQANKQAALPGLILRNQLMDGESLHDEVSFAIESDHAVVGVVVNAIDEELKGSNQVMQDYTSTTISPLVGLIDAAAGAERIVVLASDHGHVLGNAMKPHGLPLSRQAVKGKRWRTLAEDDPVYPFELELPATVWRPPGTGRIAAIWDEKVCHSHPDHGEHGGLSMAEVVAPVLLLAPDWLAELKAEEGSDLEVRRFLTPGWWELDVRPARPGQAEKDLPETAPEQQPLLPMPGLAIAEPEPEPQREEPLVTALRKSKAFIGNIEGKSDRDVETVLERLNVILAAGDSLGDRDFARRCQERPHRVAGLVARMGSVLNIDGYAMVEHDLAGQQVRLHRARLVAQFGLPQ